MTGWCFESPAFGKLPTVTGNSMTPHQTIKTYKYEVAFSFLQEDESLAYQIKDLIQDRLSTFIYSEHQKEAVGKDGVETYNKIFLEESRIVVILYRDGWGETPFTRIEQEAIKQRCYEESANFTVFISLDKNKPKWLQPFQVWYDIERYGIKSAAAIIEKRVFEYGGEVREETIADQVARHNRELTRQKEFEKYIASIEAVHDFETEAQQLLLIAERNILEINSNNQIGFSFRIKKDRNVEFTTFGTKIGLTFRWKKRYSNSLLDSFLLVFIADGDYYDRSPNRPGNLFKKEEYLFYLNEAGTKGWIKRSDKEDFKTSENVINFWQKDFLERCRLDRLKEANERFGYLK